MGRNKNPPPVERSEPRRDRERERETRPSSPASKLGGRTAALTVRALPYNGSVSASTRSSARRSGCFLTQVASQRSREPEYEAAEAQEGVFLGPLQEGDRAQGPYFLAR